MHVGGRRRGKGQRLLYFFRTPPGVRVGRAPIDEAAIRLLEQHNPDVQFDWTRILKDPQITEAAPRRDGRERDGRERDGRERRSRDRGPERPRPTAAPPDRSRPVASAARSDVVEPAVEPETADPDPDPEVEVEVDVDEVRAAAVAESEDVAELLDPDEGTEPLETKPFEPTDADRASASFARLGAEGLGRLRARYAEILARIAERPLEEDAREELKLRAERLNPDAWVTADEVTAALEQYETVFEGLRAVVGRYPRRRRRSRK